MFDSLLNLTSDEKRKIEKEIGPVKSVTEFCSSLLEATKEIPLKETLVKLLPWAAKGGRLLGEVTPLAKVLVKLADEIVKEKQPETLGLLACSFAYQRSAGLALAQQGEPADRVPFEQSLKSAREEIKRVKVSAGLAGFSLEAPFAHPFVWEADDALALVVRSAGYSDAEWRQIQRRVHEQFRADLAEVLSHGDTSAKFEPFTKWLLLGDNAAAYATLNAHIERQRWLFENRAVLNIEPFTLKNVYVDTDCGKLQWRDFPNPNDTKREASGEKFDPFSEKFGGRHPLLETVLNYLRDPKFTDAIVIQGAPGCGKSSFTLCLANALRREGLRPLRIRLKFLDLKKSLSEALAKVVSQPEDEEDPALSRLPQSTNPFIDDQIFQERTDFGNAKICPYVLILDGWDEISVAVNEGFEIEVRRMLDNVRREFLNPRVAKVRVILTGRPSHAVERSLFLRDDTPVLTIREYTPDQLESYASKVKSSLRNPTLPAGPEVWPEVNWDNLKGVFASYREDRSRLEILGLPLLAHLSLRLLAQWEGPFEPLLADRTTLYRHLLDLTCIKAGKSSLDSDDLAGLARISGLALRKMLQQTAVAITSYGNESIPFRELQLRLKKNRKQAMEAADAAGKDHPLTNLMISFYFKGGREHLGCEFLHKSFREYLYAEAVVEGLKDYGKKRPSTPPRRQPYWKDFDESDPRRQFSRETSQILCARPLTTEIRDHLSSLLAWEIESSMGKREALEADHLLDAITSAEWEAIRDTLADLWDWWGEGVHLRPQPYRDDSDNLNYHPALVNDLVDYSLPRDRGPDAPDWSPGRVVNADANVGEALCLLNAWVHSYQIPAGVVTGEAFLDDARLNPYQSRCASSSLPIVLFRPSGRDDYFHNYCNRINAAGNRSRSFPESVFFAHADFSGDELYEVNFGDANLRSARFSGAFLARARFFHSDLTDANLNDAILNDADFSGALLEDAELNRAFLIKADLSTADLSDANLTTAELDGANLSNADLRRANLSEASFQEAYLSGANLKGAVIEKARGLTREQLEKTHGLTKEQIAVVLTKVLAPPK